MQNRVSREAAINAFVKSFDGLFVDRSGGSLRGVLTHCDFDLHRYLDGIDPGTLDTIFQRADELDATLDEPSTWILTTLAIIGVASIAECSAYPAEPENLATPHSKPAAAGE